MDTVVTALSTAVSNAADGCMDSIAGVLPVALPVMGAIVVVGVGIRIFKKVVH